MMMSSEIQADDFFFFFFFSEKITLDIQCESSARQMTYKKCQALPYVINDNNNKKKIKCHLQQIWVKG